MVSIMRPEQTLRLIQLYHVNYPEIAKNNQDADGRNLKLQMWAQITDELNTAYDTQFTVEQFKKKVQNVQCTSRQKLYSGKRNLGEAEVEYLRLFESDKISETVLLQRAKNRSKSFSASPAAEFVAQEYQRPGSEGFQPMKEEPRAEENEERADEHKANEEAVIDAGNLPEECAANLSSIPSVAAGGDIGQLDTAQQILLAMLLGGIGMDETGFGHLEAEVGGGAKKRKCQQPPMAENNGAESPPPTKRSRKPDRPTRGIGLGSTQQQKPASAGTEMAPSAEGDVINCTLKEQHKHEEEAEEKTEQAATQQPVQAEDQVQPTNVSNDSGENSNRSDDQSQRTTATTTTTMIPAAESTPSDQQIPSPSTTTATTTRATSTADFDNNEDEEEGCSPADAPSKMMVPPASPAAVQSAVGGCCCQCQCQLGSQQQQQQLERLCDRLDTTNASLVRIAELLAERLPPPPPTPLTAVK